MRDNLEIELLHKSYWYDEPRIYIVQPYCIKVFKQRWYVIGYCKERNALRTFSLDRIQKLNTLDTKFIVPKDFDGNDYFENCFGIIADDDVSVEIIRIKVYGMHVQYVRALPFHHSQVEIETNNEYSIFELKMKPTFDFKQELLSRGADIEVLSPLFFREEMLEAADLILRRYL